MLDEAASATAVVNSMNYDDLMSFMRNLDRLRTAAQTNLQGRVEEGRRGKRKRSGGQ